LPEPSDAIRRSRRASFHGLPELVLEALADERRPYNSDAVDLIWAEVGLTPPNLWRRCRIQSIKLGRWARGGAALGGNNVASDRQHHYPLIAGAIGGNAVGAAAQNVNMGTAGNTVAGAVGGIAGGSLLTQLLPMLANATGGDIGAWAGQLVGGGVSGAIVSAVVGLIVNNMRQRA
jgi:hypothetical protein